jgi:ABC-2 type transport system ATP-binding protein
MPPALEVQGLHKRFGAVVALDDVSLSVPAGELLGLLGPNGAGKTTLLSIAAGLLDATSGVVRVFGETMTPAQRTLRNQIGIVPQELAIYGELTARENLAFFGRLYGLASGELKRSVDEVLEAIGLADRADDRATTFSGGMKRRLNLGAALVHRPRLLLLDEPTTGVDPHSRNHIFEEVRRLQGEGITIVYTSHYLEEVQALCPNIAILNHGRLIASAPKAELLRQAEGLIRFRVVDVTRELRERLGQLPETRLLEREGRPLELICQDVNGTLVRLLTALQELKLDLLELETEEPNLERVFLDLTATTA